MLAALRFYPEKTPDAHRSHGTKDYSRDFLRQAQTQAMFAFYSPLVNPLNARGAGGISMDFGSHPYRFTETCLVAGRACNVLGTCAENPSPADENDRNLIKRGANEKTFLITTKSEKEIEKSLRRKAVILVVIGAALIVGGVAIVLHMAGML
jgi:hypothetical protein